MSATTGIDILEQIDTMQTQVTKMAESETRPDAMEKAYADVQNKMKEALQTKEKAARETKLAVVNATLEKLKADAPKQRRTLAEAVQGISKIAMDVDKKYEVLQEPNPEDLQLVTAAKAKLAEAEANLKKAETAWFNRTAKVEAAEAEIEKAKLAITEAEAEVKQRANERLMNADLEQLTQKLNILVDIALNDLKEANATTGAQVKKLGASKLQALEDQRKAAEKLEKLDPELTNLEAEITRETDSLNSLVNGTKEYSEQLAKVSELKRQYEEKLGQRNAVLAIHQSSESFAKQFEIHEKTQMSLFADQVTWMAKLKLDKQHREITIRSRLEIMKSVNNMNIVSESDKVTSEVDMKTAEYAASAGVAVKKKTAEMVEMQPERMRRLHAAETGQKEAHEEINKRVEKIIAEMKKQYPEFSPFGEDPASPATPEDSKPGSVLDDLLK